MTPANACEQTSQSFARALSDPFDSLVARAAEWWRTWETTMAVTVEAVLEKVAAADTTADRDQLRRTVLDTIAALGLEVDRRGEVYNPAEGCYRPAPVKHVANNQRWAPRRR